jgi:tetratricopeptide (TPR) repeat protein
MKIFRPFFSWSIALFCCLLLPVYSWAQQTHALVIGLSQYQSLSPLQFADRDALALVDYLQDQRVPSQQIHFFLNENATRINIVDQLFSLNKTLKAGDRLFFYFGGHGDLEAQLSHENALLLLYNAYKTGYLQGNDFLSMAELKTWLGDFSNKQIEVVFIADACHSGALIGGKEGYSKTQKALHENWGKVTKILSSQAGEYSLEGKQWGGGRGLFSYHLINGLAGRADQNGNQKVSLRELDAYLKTKVAREAAPNVQTPVTIGAPDLMLAKTSPISLKKLIDSERHNVPLISEVNLKNRAVPLEDLLVKMDTSIVEAYKRFTRSLKEKRLASHDDPNDYALLHYKTMVKQKLPDTLLNIMKRNLAAALLQREVDIMLEPRQNGRAHFIVKEESLEKAINNLDETALLFGSDHYFYNFLQARKLVLRTLYNKPVKSLETSIDNILDEHKRSNQEKIKILSRSLELEPNMVSTYVLLFRFYSADSKPDSATYYLEKVVDLLPNNRDLNCDVADVYARMSYQENGKPTAHPKAVHYLKKAIKLDSTYFRPYLQLSEMYTGRKRNDEYHDFAKAIPYLLKTLKLYEKPLDEIKKLGFDKPVGKANFMQPNKQRGDFSMMLLQYTWLEFSYAQIGDTLNARKYEQILINTCKEVNAANFMMQSASNYYSLFNVDSSFQHLTKSLAIMQLAQKKMETDLAQANAEDKPFQNILYRENLKAIGATYRNLQRYTEAEQYLLKALGISVEGFPYLDRMKMMGSGAYLMKDREITFPLGLGIGGPNVYHYRVEAHHELFLLNLEQNKPEVALGWLEKALQVSVKENGNDISGVPYRSSILQTHKNLDVNAFQALYDKYFPDRKKE